MMPAIEGVWRFRKENEIAPEGSLHTNMGWLIPVVRCKHGNYDRHRVKETDALGIWEWDADEPWCPGGEDAS